MSIFSQVASQTNFDIMGAPSKPTIGQILAWPYTAIENKEYGALVAGGVAMYYMLGGLPFEGQSLMETVQAYGVGAGGYYVGLMVLPGSME